MRDRNYIKKSLPKYCYRYSLGVGDRIVEPLFQTGFTKHHAIYLGTDSNGIEWIAENHKFKNVQIITAEQFFATVKQIDRIEKFEGSNIERRLVINRALKLAGKPYDLITYNCEHFANEIVTGKAASKQVKKFFALSLSIFFIHLLIND